jgi:ABC-2 type transport system ATP-binding protein
MSHRGPTLEVRDVAHSFGERRALDGVDLSVRSGTITGLLGPNGAGKTTLIRVLLGVLTPARGTLTYDGHAVTQEQLQRWGYMPQERALYPAMSALEQVTFFGRLHGLGKSDAAARARDLLEELGLGERAQDRTDKLSGGMQQRLQLASALVHEPAVVVLDEPFNGLDPVAVESLSETLLERAAQGCTVLFSSHQLDLVQNLCQEIVMIDRGRTVLEGNVADLRASSGERQLRLHVGAPDQTWLAGLTGVRVVSHEADELRLALSPGTEPLEVLDAARDAGKVSDFGLDLPTLSQLFLGAAGRRVEHTEVR